MVIRHNIQAMNANRMLGFVGAAKAKSTEKLSSGYKINRSADDAAGLAISEKMRRQIRGLGQAKENIQDGISYCNVAEGALSEVSDMLARVKELAVQAANGTNTDEDREYIDSEVQEIFKEIDRVFKHTTFNEQQIWPPVLEPHASGTPWDYSLYSSRLNNGTEVGYAGIEYMGHRYSWTDLGIGWDEETQTFTETKEYKIDSSILKDDASTTADDYDSTEDSAVFTIKTTAGEPLSSVQKNYTWSADDEGIRIDGVLAKGEGITGHSRWWPMMLTPGEMVVPGDYAFPYYGMTVSFEVSEEMEWDDFINAINNPKNKIDWHSTTVGQTASTNVTSSDSKVNKISINATDKDNIANQYKVVADENKLSIQTAPISGGVDAGTGVKSSSVLWNEIEGHYQGYDVSVGSWGQEIYSDYEGSKTDRIGAEAGDSNDGSEYFSFMEMAKYTYHSGDSFLSTNVDDLTFNFTIEQGSQTPEQVLADLNRISFNAIETVSPTTAVANDTTAKIYVSATLEDNISFYTQRDWLNREYVSDTENIVDKANVIIESDDGRMGIDLGGYTMMANVYDSEYGSRIWNATNKLYNQMIDEYNAQVEVTRGSKWNTYVADAGRVIADMNSNGFLDSYIETRLKGDSFESLSATTVENVLGVDLSAMSTYADKAEALNNIWNTMSAEAKKSAFANLSADEQKTLVQRDLSSHNKENQTWIKQQYIGIAQNDASIKNKNAVLDQVIDFSTDEKVSIYKNLRDNKYSDIKIYDANSYLTANKVPTNNQLNRTESISFWGNFDDKLRLAFDTSRVAYSDFMKPKSDLELVDLIEGSSILSATDEIFTKQQVTDEFGKFMTGTTFSLNGNGESYQSIEYVTNHKEKGSKPINMAEVTVTKTVLSIQAGAEAGQHIDIEYDNMRLATLGLRGLSVSTADGAGVMLYALKGAAKKVDQERADFGAYTNRLEHAYNVNYNAEENTTAAESRIRDTDMAKEMVGYSNKNILSQVGQAILAQANQTKQGILSLLK